MPIIRLALAAILLAGCAASAPNRVERGEIRFGGETYPIRAASPDDGVWQVMADGRPVTCRKPTETDCYWSLRNYLNAQDLLDDLP